MIIRILENLLLLNFKIGKLTDIITGKSTINRFVVFITGLFGLLARIAKI